MWCKYNKKDSFRAVLRNCLRFRQEDRPTLGQLKVLGQNGKRLHGKKPVDNEDDSRREPDRMLKRKRWESTEKLGREYRYAKTKENEVEKEGGRKTYRKSGL